MKIYGDVKEFTIKRSDWMRGNWKSKLLNDNKMCCLGFYSKACGLPDETIQGVGSPGNLCLPYNESWQTFLIKENAGFDPDNSWTAYDLMNINDNDKTSDEEKETKIKTIFEKRGITVNFVD